MNYVVDYDEKEGRGLKWKEASETPEHFTFNSFFAETPKKNLTSEEEFLISLQSGDNLFVEGIGVNEALCFLASQRGTNVFRIFADDLKKLAEEAAVTISETVDEEQAGAPAKRKRVNEKTLWEAATQQPQLFRTYIPILPEQHLLRRWVRLFARFQKRFRVGVQTTMTLLRKEVKIYRHFGHLDKSTSAKKIEQRIETVLAFAEDMEAELERAIGDCLRDDQFWQKILEPIVGIGPRIGSKVASMGPRKRFRNRDHFTGAAGLRVEGGKAVRREKGKELRRDPIFFDAVLQWMLKLHMNKGEWNEMYLQAKKQYLAKGFSKFRADRAARRWTATRLLRHIWREWKKLEPEPAAVTQGTD